jgi:hypothetical protein
MSEDRGHKCDEMSTERLLLYAYNEDGDGRVEAHVKECAVCREYLAGVERVKGLIAEAGKETAGDEVVGRIMAEAGKRAGARVKRPGSRIFSAWLRMPALAAAAALVLMAVVFWRPWKDGDPGVERLYLADVSKELSELEADIEALKDKAVASDQTGASYFLGADPDEEDLIETEDEFDDGSEAWEAVLETDDEILDLDSIELAMLDMEYSLSLLDLVIDDEDGQNEFSGIYDEFEDLDLPLLPGMESGRSL